MSSSSTPIDRRTALGLVGGAGALVALTACGGGNGGSSTSTTASSVVKAGTAVVPEGMPQLEAEVRDMHLRLVAAPATAEIVAGTPTDVLSFGAEVIDGDPASVTPSGSYLGPTLHVRTGQRVQVIFENQLSQETIVHWHGLTVPQEQDGQPLEAVGRGPVPGPRRAAGPGRASAPGVRPARATPEASRRRLRLRGRRDG